MVFRYLIRFSRSSLWTPPHLPLLTLLKLFVLKNNFFLIEQWTFFDFLSHTAFIFWDARFLRNPLFERVPSCLFTFVFFFKHPIQYQFYFFFEFTQIYFLIILSIDFCSKWVQALLINSLSNLMVQLNISSHYQRVIYIKWWRTIVDLQIC